MRFGLVYIILLLHFSLAAQQSKKDIVLSIPHQVFSITEVMYHDVINPTAAARFYAYSVLTGYEILSQLDPSVTRFQNNFKDYPAIPSISSKKVDKEIAVVYGILETAKTIIPSGYLLEQRQKELLNFLKKKYKREVIDSSVNFARYVSKIIVLYSRSDGYFKLSTYSRYRPLSGDQYWRPTAPEYMPAVEPYWKTIRTFFIDSASQFRPKPCTNFSKDSSSAFYHLAKEVYDTGNKLTDSQKLIANYWDCNPFAVQFRGHMSIGLKKISPGGHWMSITGIISEAARLNFSQSMLLHTIVALGLHDAFISCWEEKYESNRIRPETVINNLIDEKWKPLIQTPPFPEFPSGHSVISTLSSELLTQLVGDHFSFTDNTETYLGMPIRKFNSFRQAAAEARISRLYGGIHFRDAIENGAEEGNRIAEFIIRKINLHPFATK